jgi:hypothetical protein
MPQDNGLLDILMGQVGAPVDPRAAFMAQNFQSLPGDPTSNYNTILDLLSPGQSQSLMEQFGGPPQLERATGLAPDEVGAFIRQQLGLQVSPIQNAQSQLEYMKMLPALGQAQAAQQTAQTGAERLQFEKTRPPSGGEQKDLMETRLMALAMGVTPEGEAVPQAVQESAFRVLRGNQAMPGLAALIQGLMQTGDLEDKARAMQILGIPAEYQASAWEWFLPGRQSKVVIQQPESPGAGESLEDSYRRDLELLLQYNPEQP